MLILVLMNCKVTPELKTEIDPNVILINYKTADRATFAAAINQVNSCNPRVIGINALFKEYRDPKQDSSLASAIGYYENVVLARGISKDSRSNEMFASQAWGEAIIGLSSTDGITTHYGPYISDGEEVKWSFPITLVSLYDPSRAAFMMNDLRPDEFYEIEYNRTQDNYKVIDIDEIGNLDCAEIKDKIILFGYLGPGEEDEVTVPIGNDNTKMYRTEIIANIISNLLEKYPSAEL